MDGKFVTAIIACAGNSSRMNGVSKMFLPLAGIPVVARTLLKFSISPIVDEIIVTAKKSDFEAILEIIHDYSISKVSSLVEGGATRFESVKNALAAISSECEYIIIHDGARPITSESVIKNTVESAFEFGAAAAGVRVKDTIKTAENGFITGTPERSLLWAIHTPQVFEKNLYLSAVSRANSLENEITDDCMLVENCGGKIKIVQDEYTNIKITTPEDVALAEMYIKDGGKND